MPRVEKSELWHEIVESLSDAVLALSADLEVLAVNAAAETLLDASPIRRALLDRLLRRNQWLGAMIRKCLASGQNLDNPETNLRLELRQATVRAEASPLTNDKGEVEGVVVLLHDLSHQKGTEQGLQGDTDGLRLSSAGLAHEVKNPLTGIKGAAELLTSMFPSDARAQQYCGLILDGVNRIASLVEQVLAVSGPHRLKRESINIHQLLHQALRIAGAHPDPPPGVIIEQLFDPSLPEVTGDAAGLERVFLNLIRNALESIAVSPGADGGGAEPPRKVRLRTAIEPQFRMSSDGRRRQFLRVEISDSGKGMAHEELKQLFTPFFTTKASGTGLGLVLSQRIVALHGGKLWAQLGGMEQDKDENLACAWARPHGMTFCVTLPIGPD
jgi:two-component system, NtrC family, nitrogen regulation sensor histidine kinase GlnL